MQQSYPVVCAAVTQTRAQFNTLCSMAWAGCWCPLQKSSLHERTAHNQHNASRPDCHSWCVFVFVCAPIHTGCCATAAVCLEEPQDPAPGRSRAAAAKHTPLPSACTTTSTKGCSRAAPTPCADTPAVHSIVPHSSSNSRWQPDRHDAHLAAGQGIRAGSVQAPVQLLWHWCGEGEVPGGSYGCSVREPWTETPAAACM